MYYSTNPMQTWNTETEGCNFDAFFKASLFCGLLWIVGIWLWTTPGDIHSTSKSFGTKCWLHVLSFMYIQWSSQIWPQITPDDLKLTSQFLAFKVDFVSQVSEKFNNCKFDLQWPLMTSKWPSHFLEPSLDSTSKIFPFLTSNGIQIPWIQNLWTP